jgi:hypothetical protein
MCGTGADIQTATHFTDCKLLDLIMSDKTLTVTQPSYIVSLIGNKHSLNIMKSAYFGG